MKKIVKRQVGKFPTLFLSCIALSAVLLGVFLAVAPAKAVTAYGPNWDTRDILKSVGKYYFCDSRQAVHNAEDICLTSSCTGCGTSYPHRAMLDGKFYYQQMCGSSFGTACAANSNSQCGGAGYYFQVTGQGGYKWRQLHFYSKTPSKWAVKGDQLGYVGGTGAATAPHVHADNLKDSTKLTAWMNGKKCGDRASMYDIVGNPQLYL